MGSEWKKTTSRGTKIGLWRIEETAEDLEAFIPERVKAKDAHFASGTPAKRIQRAAVRALVSELFPEGLPIRYDERIPKLSGSERGISITHDAEFVAVQITLEEVPAGIDLQKCRPAQLERVAKRFLNPSELEVVDGCTPGERGKMLNLLWCCKESLFKGISNVPFRECMQVKGFTPSSSGRISAHVITRKRGERIVELSYQEFGQHHLVHIAHEGSL